MNVEQWVENRLDSLEAPVDWQPDADRARAHLREKNRIYLARRRRWTWIAVALSVTFLSALAIPGRCDAPGSSSCGQPLAAHLWDAVFPKHAAAGPVKQNQPVVTHPVPPTPAPAQSATVAGVRKPAAAVAQPPQVSPTPVAAVNFKELGSPHAPVVCEIYTDYQCPPCATLYRQTLPLLIGHYVRTGKVKLVYRDFPLRAHPYARLAAQYVNAAGRLGQYDLAVKVVFATQSLWRADGSLDAQLAQALSPALIEQVRDLVRNDATLDGAITSDIARAKQEDVHQTPTIIVVSKGERQAIAGVPDFDLLKSYLDVLLAKE